MTSPLSAPGPAPTPTPIDGTLTGVRVVELGSNIAGPLAAMILGDLGADVVKIEDPAAGDDTRSLAPMVDGEATVFRSFNRNKRSVALDLRSDAGRAAARRIAERADVVIQNLRPGVADRLGLGFAAVSAANPAVIYCSISAFGPGEIGATMPGYDALVQAYSGIMASTGHPGEGGGGPVRVSASLVDISTGVWAALGVLAALMRRPALEGPQYIEPVLLDSAFTLMAHQVTSSLLLGEVPERLGSGSPSFAPYQAYRASDDWVFVAAGSNRLFEKLCDVLGCPELAGDDRFAAPARRIAHRDLLNKELEGRFGGAPVADWVARLGAAGIPACPVNDLPAALASPVTAERRLLIDGFLRLPVDGPSRQGFRPPPALGAHTREVLEEVGARWPV
ncbi:MAG TPA: CaiB/BaiF CoA-transferase family protein [Acidimicrobiia bacterium]|nr:CaiB/BaiF CoA-transferase family protein [Acidimicrobiia bacterium]